MKKILLLLACVCLLSCQSKEEKISELIKEEMFKTLYDFASYEPIETSKIDSAFSTIYQDSIIRSKAVIIIASLKLSKEYLKECEEHYQTIEIWRDSYTDRARNKVNEAREKLSKLIVNVENALKVGKDAQLGIREESKNFAPQFIGWSVTHKFRCKTKGGAYDLANYQYIFSPELDKILYSTDLESEDNEKIKTIIDEALEAKDE